jgi:hypothetical protein
MNPKENNMNDQQRQNHDDKLRQIRVQIEELMLDVMLSTLKRLNIKEHVAKELPNKIPIDDITF